MSRRVPRWHAALAGTGVLVAVGIVAARPFLLVAGVIPLWYVLVGALSRVPPGATLRAERRVEASAPRPGRPIAIELTVENVGDRTLADVRVVDGVPEALTVVAGSPRVATALRPGDEATITYAVAAKRGTYNFDAPVARLRPLAATDVASGPLPVEGDESLTAGHAVSHAPLSDAVLARAGTHPTDAGGGGIEFYATREYRPGDSVRRIDWRRYAKTGDLATVEYRAERAARTVLVVDARPVGRVTQAAGYPTGVELGAYAAERLFYAFGGADVSTSVVALGLDDDDVPAGLDPDGLAWVDPTEDGHGAARIARVFDWIHRTGERTGRSDGATATTRTDVAARDEAAVADGGAGPSIDGMEPSDDGGDPPEDGVGPSDGGGDSSTDGVGSSDGGGATVRISRLLARLPPSAQVVLVSPLLDDWPLDLVASLTAHGHPTTVLSPNATGGDTPGQRTLALERSVRLRSVPAEVDVVDWDVDRPLDATLGDAVSGGFES